MDEINEAKQEPTELDLDIDITEGMLVEVLTMSNQMTFLGKVERYRNGVMTIRESTGGELPPVLYNHDVKLRFFRKDTNIVVHAKTCGSTKWIWRVDRLKKQFIEEKRMYFRQHVKLEGQAQCVERSSEEPGLERGAKASVCKVMDVSAGGLQICTREPFQVDDRLTVKDVTIAPELGPFSFTCRVRRVRKDGGNYFCGCQIETLPDREQDRLIQAIFIAQRKEIQTQKERG